MTAPDESQWQRLEELLSAREWSGADHGFRKHADSVASALRAGQRPVLSGKAAEQMINWLRSLPLSPEGKRLAGEAQKRQRRAANREVRQREEQRAEEKRAFTAAAVRTEKRVCKRCGKDLNAAPSLKTGLGPVCAEHFVG